MYGRRAPREPTKREARLFLNTLRKAFPDEPSKYKKFVNILVEDVRVGPFSLKRLEEFFQDHPKLLLGFSVFVPDSHRPIPAEPKEELGQFKTIQTMVGKRVLSPLPTLDDALEYLISVEEAFHGQPAKYEEFLMFILTAQRVDDASAIAELEGLTRDYPNLLTGFRFFLSAQPSLPTRC